MQQLAIFLGDGFTKSRQAKGADSEKTKGSFTQTKTPRSASSGTTMEKMKLKHSKSRQLLSLSRTKTSTRATMNMMLSRLKMTRWLRSPLRSLRRTMTTMVDLLRISSWKHTTEKVQWRRTVQTAASSKKVGLRTQLRCQSCLSLGTETRNVTSAVSARTRSSRRGRR